ncbi:hypothetical protein SAY86_025855 [Trapa natans]|uniref:B box-type domain-containing protein n=1 Tax=Trapa natans TaxID=22666 RepID=A0AAN7QGZ2_TRANT|nr:hypothetical protein SAY86_025855 [Trapa natans]
MVSRVCDLCGGDASLYCDSDSAFLCFRCDADVHGANFLVARHIRYSVCSSCRSLGENHLSGARIAPLPAFCRSCSGESPCPGEEDSDSLTSESDCISSTGSASVSVKAKIRRERRGCKGEALERFSSASSLTEISGKDSARLPSREVISPSPSADRGKKRSTRSSPAVTSLDARAEAILGIWRQSMGLTSSVVDWAARALGSYDGETTALLLPRRILLAASFWLGVRMCGGTRNATWQQQIRRLEELSGVPAKLIVAAAAKIARAAAVRRAARRGHEEGCGECSA